MKRPVSVLVAIHTPAQRFLLLHRRPPARFWQSVTGSLEAAETPRDAALREVREETGLAVAAAEMIAIDTQVSDRRRTARTLMAAAAPPAIKARTVP